ncbi:MAG: methyltransferase domain-containing protein [Methylomarinum sp.]|nr:methyltransferase domain-containing protein [Methylomarinum sp.]
MSSTRISACPCCKSDKFNIFFSSSQCKSISTWQEFFYGSSDFIGDIYACSSCNYRFINTIRDHYERFYKEQILADSSSLDVFRRSYFQKVKGRLLTQFSEVPSNPSILDIGCAKGLWMELWQDKGEVFGSEYSVECIKSLKQKNITVLNQAEIKERKFDVISLFDVLEHIEDPYAYLKQVVESLLPGGLLVLGIPDMGKIMARILGHRYYLVCPMHFSYFERKSIRFLMERLFEPESIIIEKSPIMNADLRGISRWISFMPEIPDKLNFPVPIPYRASLLCFAKKS